MSVTHPQVSLDAPVNVAAAFDTAGQLMYLAAGYVIFKEHKEK